MPDAVYARALSRNNQERSLSVSSTFSKTMSSHVGTVRDRTQQFISYREKGKKFSSASVYNNGESTRLLSQHDDNSLEEGHPSKASGQDPLARLRQELQQKMSSIRGLMEDIRVLHGKASLNTFDDTRNDEVRRGVGVGVGVGGRESPVL